MVASCVMEKNSQLLHRQGRNLSFAPGKMRQVFAGFTGFFRWTKKICEEVNFGDGSLRKEADGLVYLAGTLYYNRNGEGGLNCTFSFDL